MDNKRKRRASEPECSTKTNVDIRNYFRRSLEITNQHPRISSSDNSKNENPFIQPRLKDQTKNGHAISDESGVAVSSATSSCRSLVSSRNSYNGNDEDSDIETSGIDDTEGTIAAPKIKKRKIIKLKHHLNIFMIDLGKVDRAIDNKDSARKGQAKENKERIEFIINSYNEKFIQSKDNSVYEEQKYMGKFRRSNKFELMLFLKCSATQDEETGVDMTVIHKVRFLYRKDSAAEEIFALPSGSGRYVVMQWTDSDFPLSVASAILDGKSVTEKEVKNLFDNRFLSRYKMIEGEKLTKTSEFYLRFAPQVYTRFHANVNDANSDFKLILGHNEDAEVKMQVNMDSISFPGGVNEMNKYSELCGKLSTVRLNLDLPRSREFDGYLSKVNYERKIHLDDLLLTELVHILGPIAMFVKPDDTPICKLKDFLITHKNSTKYFEATEFGVYYNQKLLYTSKKRPSLEDIRFAISKIAMTTKPIRGIKSIIDSLYISITTKHSEEEIKEKFFKCLEGIFYDDKEEKNYWRVGGWWYQVSSNYTFQIYTEYIKVLKTSLLPKLEYPLFVWPLSFWENPPAPIETGTKKSYDKKIEKYKQSRFVCEATYNNLHKLDPNFIVTDSTVVVNGTEICDLFQYIPDAKEKSKMYLHHVKKVFGADGYRVCICQMIASAYNLYDALKSQGSNIDTSAYKLFHYIQSKRSDSTLIPTDYDEFREQLTNATFVCSILFLSGKRELDKDYDVLMKYNFRDFEKRIDEKYRDNLQVQLELYLLKNEYIYPDGEFTLKWFMNCSKGFNFQSEVPFPGKEISNLRQADLFKILKERYYKPVDALSTKQLIVHMSELFKSLGFGFKICQIEGEEDYLLPKILEKAKHHSFSKIKITK